MTIALPMPIPYGTRYTASATASVWRPVTCSNCRCDFAYVLERTGDGAADSVLWIDTEGAKASAREGALASLEDQIEGDFEAVSCPDCGHYQEYMLQIVRDAKRRFMLPAGLTGLGVAAVMIVGDVPLAAIGFGVLGGAALAFNGWLVHRYNPNASAATRAKRDLSREPRILRRKDYELRTEREGLPAISWRGATNVARVC